MEPKVITNTEAAAENGESGKHIQFPNLLIAAAILFSVNVIIALFFFLSPNYLGATVRADDSSQYAIAKSSAFEERVQDVPYRPRPVEKVRPVIEAAIPAVDPALNDPLNSGSAAPVSTDANSVSSVRHASYTVNTGDRPVTSAAYQSENTEDASAGTSHVTASLAPRTTDLQ